MSQYLTNILGHCAVLRVLVFETQWDVGSSLTFPGTAAHTSRLIWPPAPPLHTRGENFLFFFNVYLFSRERESRGGAEREEDRGPKEGSALRAESLMRGSNS